MGRAVLIDRRDAHQARDVEVKLLATEVEKPRKAFRRDPRLLRLPPGVDLHEKLRPPLRRTARVGDPAGDPFPVDAVDRVEELDCPGHLVGLERPDEVQLDAPIG
jgi:hypothetical protein